MTQEKFDQAAQLLSQICSIEQITVAAEKERKKGKHFEIKLGSSTCGFYLEEFKQDFIDVLEDEKEKFQRDFGEL